MTLPVAFLEQAFLSFFPVSPYLTEAAFVSDGGGAFAGALVYVDMSSQTFG